MNSKVNYHTHTFRCKHADGTEKDYVLEALKKNFKKLGFSDHGPYPDDRFGFRMDYCELNDYVNTVKNLEKEFEDKLNISVGLEIEYDPNSHEYYKYLLNELRIDYLALGQHMFLENNEFTNTYFLTDTKQYLTYAKSIKSALSTGFFKFVAHPDLIFINDLPWDDNCDKASSIIIEAAKKYDSILELNANGIRRGLNTYCDGTRYPYPHRKFWDKASSNNIKVLINSDCHSPNQLWDEKMDDAYSLANELNLNIVYDI
ncbi:histidinol-phosphatase [Clostridium sp. BJN0001]|uniref:histidinol-phosphatase n=1 Tax=Clostridium sp. BJN0001 TaxID=2930219 RepID=UPI001FD104D5|nr:histidinol-phosphatase [Clostridium sp. BJN0001]